MGSPLHTAVLKAITEISKHFDPAEGDANKGVDQQSLLRLAQQASQQSPQAGIVRALGGAPPPPGAAPSAAAA